jgi:hypothetical protein
LSGNTLSKKWRLGKKTKAKTKTKTRMPVFAGVICERSKTD